MAVNLTIDVNKFPSVAAAIKKFKKKVDKAGIIDDCKQHSHFEKPSAKRRRKLNDSIRRSKLNKK